MVVANIALDAQQYYHSALPSAINGETIYANNYALSDIRAWLNDSFYITAFNSSQKDVILTTAVDNSESSTKYSANTYACANTDDKVFLLSYKEITSYFSNNSARQFKSTDYAKSQGCYATTGVDDGNCYYILRSPHCKYDSYVSDVGTDGSPDYCTDVINADVGIIPALTISLA